MNILKIYPAEDSPIRHNYHINYGLWDAIPGHETIMGQFKLNLSKYDAVFLPQFKRWKNHLPLLSKIKKHGIKTVLFDNDSCYRSFTHEFYKGISFIFYRDTDKDNRLPQTPSQWLPWSIDTRRYTPVEGGNGVLFNCSISKHYPLRKQISTIIEPTSYKGNKYIQMIQQSAAAIHTDSPTVPAVRAKALEFAACATHIISNHTSNMEKYFPHELITYFNSLEELKEILHDFKPDPNIQKQLREITVQKHDNAIRAKQVIQTLKKEL